MASYLDDIVRASLAGRRQIRKVEFPGRSDLTIGVRALTDAETDQVRLEAINYCKKHKVDSTFDPDFFDRVIMREMISRAFVDPDSDPNDPKPFFGTSSDVAELDVVTVRALYEIYDIHLNIIDPYVSITKDQAMEVASLLGKSQGSAEILKLYDASSLRNLCLSLAELVRETSRTAN